MVNEKTVHKSLVEFLKWQYPKVIFNTDMSGIWLPPILAKQAAGLRSDVGYPDLTILEARGGYFGLFIEVKAQGRKVYKKNAEIKKNKGLIAQERMRVRLLERGYFCTFASGFAEGRKVINEYMGHAKTIV